MTCLFLSYQRYPVTIQVILLYQKQQKGYLSLGLAVVLSIFQDPVTLFENLAFFLQGLKRALIEYTFKL